MVMSGYYYYETQQLRDSAETHAQWHPGFWTSLRSGAEGLRASADRWQRDTPTLTPATLRLYRVPASIPWVSELVISYQITPGRITAEVAPKLAGELRRLLSEEPGLLTGEPA
jgi:hypothetical protein